MSVPIRGPLKNRHTQPLPSALRPFSEADVSETGKTCGDCGLCCKLLGIEAIKKAPGQWCGHFRKGVGGCGIYE